MAKAKKAKKDRRGAPKGHKRSMKHGFYAAALSPAELEHYQHAEVGGLDDEIRVAKAMLNRSLEAQRLWEALGEGLTEKQLAELMPLASSEKEWKVSDKDGHIEKYTREQVFRRKTDFQEEIRKWMRVISSLEAVRTEILEKGRGATPVEDLARELRAFEEAAADSNPGGEL